MSLADLASASSLKNHPSKRSSRGHNMEPKKSEQPPPSAEEKPGHRKEPPARKEIPLVSVPNDRETLAQEMEELFDEDRVTHKHGSSEPEAD